ncbi:MAG: pyrroline-5-carboxylate reductase [Gammaproteobacteria bacterium]|nr:pyrroline-5-carboxylate reductase [Gammaproteobacteria bacterium]
MEAKKIGFIGAGNMATALIGGLISDDDILPGNIIVSDINDQHLNDMESKFGIRSSGDNIKCVEYADVVVICVKPQMMNQICKEIAETVSLKQSLIISVAAGITTENFGNWLGGKTSVVRAMPNTPALIKTGAAGLFANENVSLAQKEIAENILRAVGVVLWVDKEKDMDHVTALSGSGPAYFFRMMEAMENAAIELGLEKETAHILTLQTALGAAKLAIESSDSISELRKKVTSPGGTTAKGLSTMQEEGVDGMFQKTLQAASNRAEELSKEYGES